jgi:ABC-type glycerol-3-phosphate transport system substrate-binding protein
MRKAISRREFLSTVAITAAGAVLAACGKKATEATEEAPVVVEAPPTAEPVSINMWGWTDLVNTELVTKFMEKYPNITVNMSDIGDAVFGDQKFLSAVAAGTGPDVAIQNRHTFMQFAAKKLYKEVTSLLETSNMKISDFTPVQIAETSWQGKVFGLPMFTDVRYLYWNKKIYSEVGLDPNTPPTTWEELEAFTDKCNIKNDKGEYDRFGFVPYLFGNSWMWLYGFLNKAPSISDDKRTILCDDKRWVDALDWMVKFYDNYVGTFELANAFSEGISAAGLGDPFGAEKVAMSASGDWQVGDWLRIPDLDWDCAPMPIPSGGEKSTWSCGWSVVMSPSTKQEAAAWELIKWHVTPEGFRARAEASLTDTKRVWEREQIEGEPQYWPTQACYLPTLDMLEKEYVSKLGEREKKAWTLGIDALENWTHGCGTEMGVAALEYWVEMDNATRSALAHQVTAAEAMKQCKKKVQEATDRAFKAIDEAG